MSREVAKETGYAVLTKLGKSVWVAAYTMSRDYDGIPVFSKKIDATKYFKQLKELEIEDHAVPQRVVKASVSFEEVGPEVKSGTSLKDGKVQTRFTGWAVVLEMKGMEESFSCQPLGDSSLVYQLFLTRSEARKHASVIRRFPNVTKASPIRAAITVTEE